MGERDAGIVSNIPNPDPKFLSLSNVKTSLLIFRVFVLFHFAFVEAGMKQAV